MKSNRALAPLTLAVAGLGTAVLAACGGSSTPVAAATPAPTAAPTTAAPATAAPTAAAPTTAAPTTAAPRTPAQTTPAAPAATQAAPQVIIVQPAPVQTQTQYVQVPDVTSTYARPSYRFQLILGYSGHPAGPFVPMHTGPNASTPQVQPVYDGDYYSFDCQTYGGPVYGDWGTSYLWDRVTASGQVLGYISDEWVHTGSDSRVLPSC